MRIDEIPSCPDPWIYEGGIRDEYSLQNPENPKSTIEQTKAKASVLEVIAQE